MTSTSDATCRSTITGVLEPRHSAATAHKPTRAPVRVALDVTPTIGPTTGIGNHVVGLRQALARRSEAVTVIPLVMSWSGRQQGGATHRPLPAKVRRLWMHTDHPRIERFVGPIDVVHGTNFVVPPARAAQIVTIHDLTVLRFPELVRPDNRAFVPLIQRAVARGAWVHAVSHAVADEVRAWLPHAHDRVVAIPAGVPDLAQPEPPDPATIDPKLTELLDPRSGASMVLSIGTEEPRKGLDTLINALQRLMDHDRQLIWVHAGPRGWASDKIDEQISAVDPSIRARMFRLGFVSSGLRTHLLQRANVFTYPSLYEGFGMPPLEAMTVGVPVVASDIAAHREAMGDAGLLFPVGDADSLANEIRRVLDDDLLSDSLSERGMHNVRRYNWATMADEMICLYQQLAATQ